MLEDQTTQAHCHTLVTNACVLYYVATVITPEAATVLDPLSGMAAALRNELEQRGIAAQSTIAPDELPDWLKAGDNRVAIITLDELIGWPTARNLADAGLAGMVFGLVDLFETGEIVRALGAGIRMVAARKSPPEEIVDVALRSFNGVAVLPLDVFQSIARRARPDSAVAVDEDQMRWLQLLADGRTTQELAAETGYSERAMFRMLHDLYGRLGVTNRQQALIFASRHGLLDRST